MRGVPGTGIRYDNSGAYKIALFVGHFFLLIFFSSEWRDVLTQNRRRKKKSFVHFSYK